MTQPTQARGHATQARGYDQIIRRVLEVDAAGRAACQALGGIVRLRAIRADIADKLLVQSRKLRAALDDGDAEAIETHGAAMGRGWAAACAVLAGAEAQAEPSKAARDFTNECARRWPGAALWDERSLERTGEP
jgi:hypothetical protein